MSLSREASNPLELERAKIQIFIRICLQTIGDFTTGFVSLRHETKGDNEQKGIATGNGFRGVMVYFVVIAGGARVAGSLADLL
jgi:hypothetical protein